MVSIQGKSEKKRTETTGVKIRGDQPVEGQGATGGNTDAAVDKAGLLNVSDEFSRAKRNVLFWAAVTILISVGQTSPDGELQLTSILTNLTLKQNFLLIFSLVILALMFLGYLRAETRLRHENLEAVYGASVAELQKTIDGATKDIAAWQKQYIFEKGDLDGLKGILVEDYQRIEREVEVARDFADRISRFISGNHSDVKDDLNELIWQLESNIKESDPPRSDRSILDRLTDIRKKLGLSQTFEDRKLRFDAENPQVQIRLSMTKDEFAANIDNMIENNHPELPAEINYLFDKLTKFSAKIVDWEKSYFYFYDRGVVWVSVFVSGAFAFVQLLAHDFFVATLAVIGWSTLEPPQSQSQSQNPAWPLEEGRTGSEKALPPSDGEAESSASL